MSVLFNRPLKSFALSANDYDIPFCDFDNHDDGGDDIYIMMQCLFLCVSRKIITSNFQAERRRREVSRPLDLAGRRPAFA